MGPAASWISSRTEGFDIEPFEDQLKLLGEEKRKTGNNPEPEALVTVGCFSHRGSIVGTCPTLVLNLKLAAAAGGEGGSGGGLRLRCEMSVIVAAHKSRLAAAHSGRVAVVSRHIPATAAGNVSRSFRRQNMWSRLTQLSSC